jgi:putative ribosome biogenesis GTPase RsgA
VAVDAAGAIGAILGRRGTLVRRAPGQAPAGQVLAANVDLALVVESLPEPNERRAERLIALASADDIRAALVLTKVGLADDGQAVTARDPPDAAFADSEGLAARCRFADCAHETEPGCAVRDIVDPERLTAWRELAREQARLEDRKAAALERRRSGRALSREIKAAKRANERWRDDG